MKMTSGEYQWTLLMVTIGSGNGLLPDGQYLSQCSPSSISPYGVTRPQSVQFCHNECDGVSNHLRLCYLLNRLFRHRSKKTSKHHVTGLCEGNSPVTGEFPAQRASNTENVSISWPHHGVNMPTCPWMSPHTVTGVDTGWTLDSSSSNSLTKSQSFWKKIWKKSSHFLVI